jgi:hypothetical protein
MTETIAPYAVEGEVLTPMHSQIALPVEWLQPNGLMLPDDISEQEWANVGFSLLFVNEADQYLVGDWYNYGVRRWGPEQVAGLLEHWRRKYPYLKISQWKLKTIRNYASVCKSFPLHSRNWEHLGFWHYYKICGYESDERVAHLEHANTMQMSPSQFEAYLTDQDKRRKRRERDRRSDEIAASNGHLKNENKGLSATVNILHDEVEELTARNQYLEQSLREAIAAREERLAEARHGDGETEGGDWREAADEAWERDRGNPTVTCPHCGRTFEL